MLFRSPLIDWDFLPIGSVNINVFSFVLVGLCFLSAYVMNAEIPLFSLKIKNFSFAKYKLQIAFVTTAVLLIGFFTYLGVALTIVLYVVLSVLNNLFFSKK